MSYNIIYSEIAMPSRLQMPLLILTNSDTSVIAPSLIIKIL